MQHCRWQQEEFVQLFFSSDKDAYVSGGVYRDYLRGDAADSELTDPAPDFTLSLKRFRWEFFNENNLLCWSF